MKKIIVITGAGGTVGYRLVKYFLSFNNIEIRAIDKSEIAIASLLDLNEGEKLKTYLLDINNINDLGNIIKNSSIIIHCAALKHLRTGVIFPEELATQNILNFCNIVKMAKKYKVKKVLLCSTDKAATPTSVMGASKLLMERILHFSSNCDTKFAAVRFGNIVNSSGSIIPKIIFQLSAKKEVRITNRKMTRYLMLENDFLDLIRYALDNMKGGEIFIPDTVSVNIGDLADVVIELYCKKNKKSKQDIKVINVGNIYEENIHERMINENEIENISISGNYFILHKKNKKKCSQKTGRVLLNSAYNTLKYTEIKKILENLKLF